MTTITAQPTRPNIAKSYNISPKSEGLLSWEWVEQQMTSHYNYWVSSVRPDGTPHSVPVSGIWMDGVLYFGGDRLTRRSRNLAANPHVSVHLESADEVVIIEGLATEVVDPDELKVVARALTVKFNDEIMTTLTLDPGNITYKITPQVVLAWLDEDLENTATRWVIER
jgi:nitroimidazol reductase NimA-like FMN-containing flavoprotein (pyridoxamine 5'-phosphate oxidase superfamily)